MNRRTLLAAATCAVIAAAGGTLAGPAGVTVDEIRVAFEGRDIQAREMVQRSLKGTGYYEGPIDGAWGPGTASAYRELMGSDRYRRHAPGWTWSHEVQVLETMFFLTTDAYP
jgi:hypothetical protein